MDVSMPLGASEYVVPAFVPLILRVRVGALLLLLLCTTCLGKQILVVLILLKRPRVHNPWPANNAVINIAVAHSSAQNPGTSEVSVVSAVSAQPPSSSREHIPSVPTSRAHCRVYRAVARRSSACRSCGITCGITRRSTSP